MDTADAHALLLEKKPLPADDKQEQYPPLIYDPIRHDVRKYLEEKAPVLSLSVDQIGVRRLPDGTGYGGIFAAGDHPFFYVMTGKGFKFRKATDTDQAQTALQEMLDEEQRKAAVVRQQESVKDLDGFLLDIGKSTRVERDAYQREVGHELHIETKNDKINLVFKALSPFGMKVPDGGSSCAKCRFVTADKQNCGNKAFIKWHKGDPKLPAPANEYCCNAFKPKMGLMKALPKTKEEKVKQAKPSIKAGEKKAGKGPLGKTRYDYPTEKGKPGAPPKVKKPKGKRPPRSGAADPEGPSSKPKKPTQQVPGRTPDPPPDPQEAPFVDPKKLAKLLQMDVGVLRKVAMKFQGNPKMNGRKGFIRFMTSQLKSFVKKHNLDDRYFGLVYDALVQTTDAMNPSPQNPGVAHS